MKMLDYYTFTGYSDPDTDRAVLKDTMGRYRTNIFYEFNTSRHEEYPPLYTMREDSWAGLPSAYRIYMTSASEYEAAMKLVGSWNHWQRLLNIPVFMNGPKDVGSWAGLHQWREEKEIQDRAMALLQLKENAEKGNVTAQKLIYEGEKKRGRPSKSEVKQAAEQMAKDRQEIRADLDRIKVVSFNGEQAGSN